MRNRREQLIALITVLLALSAGSVRADGLARARALLLASQDALRAAHSITADFVDHTYGDAVSGRIECVKPNKLRYETYSDGSHSPVSFEISDGKSVYVKNEGAPDTIISHMATPDGIDLTLDDASVWTEFYSREPSSAIDDIISRLKNVRVTSKNSRGSRLSVITFNFETRLTDTSLVHTYVKVSIGRDKIIRSYQVNNGDYSTDIEFTNIRLNRAVPSSDFTFTKSPDTKVVPCDVDQSVFDILRHVELRTASTRSEDVELTTDIKQIYPAASDIRTSHINTDCTFERPNRLRVEQYSIPNRREKRAGRKMTALYVADGSSVWSISDYSQKLYTKRDEPKYLMDGNDQIDYRSFAAICDFFYPHWLYRAIDATRTTTRSVKDLGIQTWNGTRYRLIQFVTRSGPHAPDAEKYTLYIAPDQRVHRLVSLPMIGSQQYESDTRVTKLTPNRNFPRSTFEFHRPPGFRLSKQIIEWRLP